MSRERLVVIAPGPTTTGWVGRESFNEPALVAVDRNTGRPRHFGEGVLSAVAGRWDQYDLVSPFSATDLFSSELTLAYVRWFVASAPHVSRRPATAFLVPAAPPTARWAWRAVGDRLAGATVILLRPMTVAAGLGLDVDSAVPHLIIDVRADGTEVSVVGESAVLAAEGLPGSDPDRIAVAVSAVLARLDPDLEYEVRGEEAHVVGMEWEDSRALSDAVGLPVQGTADHRGVLAAGIRADRRLIDAYFGVGHPRSGAPTATDRVSPGWG